MYDIAKKVSAGDFIGKLTNGYQFSVGERGAKLSGGQRQRITLARSFIGNRSIVVFDEATAASNNFYDYPSLVYSDVP